MTYRVEELAISGGVSVDTVRYYQGLGLLPAPIHEGRIALYDEAHVHRLGRIRELADSGFTLRQIGDLVDNGDTDPLLEALVDQRPQANLSLAELEARTGVAEPLLRLGINTGLLRPTMVGGEERFDEGQEAMVNTAGRLLESGVDLEPLVALATAHAANIESLVADAVALYRVAVDSDDGSDRQRIARDIEALVPAVTRLVSDHFSRTLIDHVAGLVDDSRADRERA